MGLGSGIRDTRSGIRDPEKNLFRIPDPGSRGQKGTGSRIRIRNTRKMAGFSKLHASYLITGSRYAVTQLSSRPGGTVCLVHLYSVQPPSSENCVKVHASSDIARHGLLIEYFAVSVPHTKPSPCYQTGSP
jgi:hypothetical protein